MSPLLDICYIFALWTHYLIWNRYGGEELRPSGFSIIFLRLQIYLLVSSVVCTSHNRNYDNKRPISYLYKCCTHACIHVHVFKQETVPLLALRISPLLRKSRKYGQGRWNYKTNVKIFLLSFSNNHIFDMHGFRLEKDFKICKRT